MVNQRQDLTEDRILGGRIKILQPAQGYRVAIDPVFLAASIPATAADTILDVGTGVGAAAFCLAKRVTNCHIVGLELQRDMVRIATQNIDLNGLRGMVDILHGDLIQPPPRLAPSTFSHVMANPPFYFRDRVTPSLVPNKQVANSLPHGATDLKAWVNFACLMAKPQGTVTFIYPTDNVDNLLYFLHGKVGNISIFPLWTSESRLAKRVIVRGVKNMQGPTQLAKGIVLHGPDGKFTAEAEAVLRHAAAISF